jgi:hypothetical protein
LAHLSLLLLAVAGVTCALRRSGFGLGRSLPAASAIAVPVAVPVARLGSAFATALSLSATLALRGPTATALRAALSAPALLSAATSAT